MRRLIEEDVGEERYRDEIRAIEATPEDHEEGPRVVPSTLVNNGNE